MTKLLKLFAVAWLAMLSLGALSAQSSTAQATGTISTRNLNPAGAATALSAVEIGVTGESSLSVHVKDAYTASGGLSAQAMMIDGTWVTLCSSVCTNTFTRATTGQQTATIASGVEDIFAISFPAGAVKVRVTPISGAVTGGATILLQTSTSGGGVSSGGGAGDASNSKLDEVITAINTASPQLPPATGTQSIANSLSMTPATSATFPVSAASLPLPTGAATSANQTPGSATASTDATRVPVSEPDGLQVTGTCTTCSSNQVLFAQSLVGYGSWAVQVTSAGSSSTITYQVSTDSGACSSATNWANILGGLSTGTGSLAGSATSTTAVYTIFPRAAAMCARAITSTPGTGTVTVQASFSKVPYDNLMRQVSVGNSISLNGGQALQGATVATTPGQMGGDARAYNSNPTAVSAGQMARLLTDLFGTLRVYSEWSFSNITTNTTTTVKSGAGVVHTICINTKGATANTATVYDNTAASGTKLGTIDTTTGVGCMTYNAAFGTGLTVVTAAGTAADMTVTYK